MIILYNYAVYYRDHKEAWREFGLKEIFIAERVASENNKDY